MNYKQKNLVGLATLKTPINLKPSKKLKPQPQSSCQARIGKQSIEGRKLLSEPGFNPGTGGLWAHHASAAPLWLFIC